MIDRLHLTELACRASNLSERIKIINNLSQNFPERSFPKKLSSLDKLIISRLVGKFSTLQIKKEIYEKSLNEIPKRERLEKILTDYRLYELNLTELPQVEREVFLQEHCSWLEIYQASLETLERSPDDWSSYCWYDLSIYYERFAKVSEPFLRLLQQNLQAICQKINTSNEEFNISQQVITDIQLEFLNRVELVTARAIEADINLYCHKNNIVKTSNSEDYIAYIKGTFSCIEDYHTFFCKFPTLCRWMSSITGFLSEFGKEIIVHLFTDKDEVSKKFFSGLPIQQIKSFKLGLSDPHAEGRSVVILNVEIATPTGITRSEKIVYKPRCIKSELGFQGLLQTLSSFSVIEFPVYKVLSKDNYGYVEFLPVDNYTNSEAIVELFYKQLGGYLAIFYILGGSDIHFENILVSRCKPFICDCETLLDVLPEGIDREQKTLFDSVFRTGMLDWPRAEIPGNKLVNHSGYTGGESYQAPFLVPRISNRMSLALAVTHEVGVEVKGVSNNRIYFKERAVKPQDYREFIVEGFNNVYSLIQNHASKFVELVQEFFADSTVRFVNRSTLIYVRLLNAVRHPKCLSDPLEADLIFHSLVEYPRKWDKTAEMSKLEVISLWQLDVPIFTTNAANEVLSHNYQQLLSIRLSISSLDNALKRVQQLSTDNQQRQNQYIYASLSTDEINSHHFVESAVQYAYQIGNELCSQIQTDSELAPWKTYDFAQKGNSLANVNASLYNGSAGICLFLAYLNALMPYEPFRLAAERALEYSLKKTDPTEIGAFQGTGGLIYLLIHLASLWKQPTLLKKACELSNAIATRIHQDRYFDILQGSAGVIPVMLSLANASSGIGVDCAKQCAAHLLKSAVVQNGTLSWPCQPDLGTTNLTGFSHGASGIGWALILLGSYLNQPDYIAAGRQAYAYETSQFDTEQHNWYDLRTSVVTKQSDTKKFGYYWCNGAVGIGLSRIMTWAELGKTDSALLDEAYIALNVTLRNFNKIQNDSLCHGRSGNAELLLRCAELLNEPYLRMEANVQATIQWTDFEKYRRWNCTVGDQFILPDLMTGLAGIGMHFLRLAYPNQIPSPLLLDPPYEQLGSHKKIC